MRSIPMLAALALLAPLAAQAADLPVRYTVDEKQLKNAISGTNLTFQLYSDATCTTVVDTSVVTIDAVTIRERIKQFKPKNGAAQLKVVELHRTFTTAATGNLYLKVTGTGVVAVGGACQPQAAAIAGGAGGGAVIKDGLGIVMGPTLDGASFLTQVGPQLVRLGVVATEYVYGSSVFHAGLACTGQGYAFTQPAGLFAYGYPYDATQFYVGPTSAASLVAYNSILDASSYNYSSQSDCDLFWGLGNATFVAPHACCINNSPSSGNFVPITLQTLPTFTPPFSLVP